MPRKEDTEYEYILPPFKMDGQKFPGLIRASSITPKEVTFLWYPYIPFGAATLLFGPGGTGKSHLTVDLVARLTTGRPFPLERGYETPAAPVRAPQRVLMLSAEDDFEKVLVPRLLHAGANMDNVGFPQDPFIMSEAGVHALYNYLKNFDASIVFIDPIVHYIGGKVDMNKSNEVRAAIGVFHQMAKDMDMAVVLVGHSRKGQEGEDYEKAMGSVDFNNAVRSVLYATRAPDGTRLMKHVKANYSALGDPMAYDFGHNGPGSFDWLGVFEGDDTPIEPSKRPKRSNVVEKLREWLKDGPVASKEVEKLAEADGISWRTLSRAKEGVAESFLRWKGTAPVWYMRLLGDEKEPEGVELKANASPAKISTVDGGQPGGGEGPEVAGSDGSQVDPEPGTGPEGETPAVGGGGSGGRPDPKAIAAAFLQQKGLTNG